MVRGPGFDVAEELSMKRVPRSPVSTIPSARAATISATTSHPAHRASYSRSSSKLLALFDVATGADGLQLVIQNRANISLGQVPGP